MKKSITLLLWSFGVVGLLLSGCGGGGSSDDTSAPTSYFKYFDETTQINDYVNQAQEINENAKLEGSIDSSNDPSDFFKYKPSVDGAHYYFLCGDNNYDSDLFLYDESGELASSTSSGSIEVIEKDVSQAKEYFLQVYGFTTADASPYKLYVTNEEYKDYDCSQLDNVATDQETETKFEHITVDKVESTLTNAGYSIRDGFLHEDGFGNGGSEVDIGNVILFTIDGKEFNDDLGFAFDFQGDFYALANAKAVLYLDTDNNNTTGMQINGIGADIRLTHFDDMAPDGTEYYQLQWNASAGNWSTYVYTSSSGGAVDGVEVSGGGHGIVAVNGTGNLFLYTAIVSPVQVVLAIEIILPSDPFSTYFRYDATEKFIVR